MNTNRRTAVHDIMVAAPARTVLDLIASVEMWPEMFPPSVHVACLERDGQHERIQIWAVANDTPKTWTSRRRVAPAEGRIEFRQEVSAPPVAEMGGTWVVEPDGGSRCTVRLHHDYRAVDDDPDALAWIDAAVDRNSRSELAALRRHAELVAGTGVMTFQDSVLIDGDPADVFAFIDEADRWPERLPHVASVRLCENEPGLQMLEMDTRSPDGGVHTTKSMRVCFGPDRIVYKQTRLPALMTLHIGEWTFERRDGATLATSRHTVVVDEEAIPSVLGAGASVEDARRAVRRALGANSTATLEHAKAAVEGSELRSAPA